MLSAPLLALSFAAGIGALFFGLRSQLRGETVADEYNEFAARKTAPAMPTEDAPLVIRLLGDLGARLKLGPVGALIDGIEPRRLTGLEQTLGRAGHPWGITGRDVIAMQLAGGVTGSAVGVVLASTAGIGWIWGLAAGAALALVPRGRIKDLARRRTTEILLQLPNFLDLLLVNARAGQPIQRGFELAGDKLDGALATEIRHVASLMRVGESEEQALVTLADRTGLDEMHRLASALITALRFGGANLTESLQLLATQVRTDWRQRTQTQIERTKVWLWFPLTVCFVPAFVLILVGPSIIQIGSEL